MPDLQKPDGERDAAAGKSPKVKPGNRRAKGTRFESSLAAAIAGKRVPFSGQFAHLGKEWGEDVSSPDGYQIQCKIQANGYRTLYKWLKTADMLAIKADGQTALIVMPLPIYQKYLKAAGYDTKD